MSRQRKSPGIIQAHLFSLDTYKFVCPVNLAHHLDHRYNGVTVEVAQKEMPQEAF